MVPDPQPLYTSIAFYLMLEFASISGRERNPSLLRVNSDHIISIVPLPYDSLLLVEIGKELLELDSLVKGGS